MDSTTTNELSVRDLIAILRRRRRIIYGTLLTFIGLAAVYCLISTRRYEAVGTIQVQKESADAMGLQSMMGTDNGATDALEANINLQTQADVLQSDTLALSTINTLHLEGTKDFQPHWSPVGAITGPFSPTGVADPPGSPLESSPQRLRQALQVFRHNLKVSPLGGTRLIEIRYLSPDPKVAADVVNSLMKGLVDYTFQTRYMATAQTSEWLTSQLQDLRKNSEDLQSKVVSLQREVGVYSLGTVDAQGREQAYSGVLDQLQQATAAVAQAEQNRILKEAIAQATEHGNAETLSSIAGNTNAQTMNSMAVIQTLRQQEASQQAALVEAQSKYGPSYPKLIELRSNIAGLDRAIQQEVERIRGRAQSDYAVAVEAESNTRRQYEAAKASAAKLNDKAVEFAIVHQEADQSRELYEDLLKRLKEAGVLEGLRSSNITIVDPGRIPGKPNSPNVPLYMGVSVTGGLMVGCLGSFFVDALDTRINTSKDVQRATGRPPSGALPYFKPAKSLGEHDGQSRLISVSNPGSPFTEAVRALRTALSSTNLEGRPRVILVTSSVAGEGKTVLSSNLAVLMAQSGLRGLLVDTDMRHGGLQHILNIPDRPGLSELLTGKREPPDALPMEGQPCLAVLTAGQVPSNPSELLSSKAFETLMSKWRKQYDFVVLDSTPLLPVTDSIVVSRLADITLVLVRLGVTEQGQVERSCHLLNCPGGSDSVGIVLNGMRPDDENYSGYFG